MVAHAVVIVLIMIFSSKKNKNNPVAVVATYLVAGRGDKKEF